MDKFKPLKSEKVVISMRIDINMLKKIDDTSNKVNLSRNELINQCLNYALKNIEFKDSKKDKSK